MKIRTALTAIVSPTFIFAASSVAWGQETTPDAEDTLDRIVVVGTQTNLASARAEVAITPGGTELIDMDAFRGRNVSSLADVLHYSPGVWSASDSGNDSMFFSSRGSNLDATDYDMNGIKLLKDGLPITTADGSNHNRLVDPLSAEHATVARGANAMKYGASTLGGAINFVSVTARDSNGVDLSFTGGSHGQMLGRVTLSEVFDDRFDALLTVEGKAWDGYREHNAQERAGAYGNLGWRFSDALATRFYGAWIENDQELPGSLSRAQLGADRDQAHPDAVGGNYQLDADVWRIASKTSWRIDDRRRLDVGFSIEEQSLFHPIVDQVLVDFDGDGPQAPVEIFSLLIDTDHRNVGAILRYNHLIGAHDLLLGVNYAASSADGGNYRNLGGTRNGLSTLVDNDATLLEAFAMDRWELGEQLTLILAAQTVAAHREIRNTDVQTGVLRNPEDDYASINPRIGVLYDLQPEVSLYANLSRLFEPPTNFELEDNVAGGDAALGAMRGTTLEIGARGRHELRGANQWSWDLSLYYARIEDEILSIDDPQAPGTSLSTNVDDTIHAGFEAVARGRFAPGNARDRFIEPLLSLSVNEFTFDHDVNYGDNRLPAAPRYVLRGEIIYRDGSGRFLGPTFELVGDRYADFANTFEVDSYALVGLRAGWSGEAWSVHGEIRNLLDEDYVATHGVRDIAARNAAILYPGAPLSAYVGFRWRIE